MIDFSASISKAYNRTESLLFKPFDLGRWCILGFCAFLVALGSGGSSGNFRFPSGHNSNTKPDFDFNHIRHSMHDFFFQYLGPEWKLILIVLIVALVLVLLIIGLILCWLGARGQFMLLDNLVHGRFEVAKPWNEQGSLADKFFVFYTVMAFGWLFYVLLLVAGGLAVCWPYLLHHKAWSWHVLPPLLVLLLVLLISGMVVAVFFRLLREFGIPIMYRTRCGILEACRRVWRIVAAHPLDCFIYLLVRFVIGLVSFVIALLAGCCTCCVGFLPYVHSVITLPVPVFRVYFTLECLARLDPEYDLLSAATEL